MKVTIIAACTNASGEPDFTSVTVDVSKEQYENGEHYDLAGKKLLNNGFDEPFVLFDARDVKALCWGKIKKALADTFQP